MERFATEVLESKISLAKSKCESLRASQKDLLACIATLNTRLEHLTEHTKPIEGQESALKLLKSLKRRLINANASLDESLRRLSSIEQRLQIAKSGSTRHADL